MFGISQDIYDDYVIAGTAGPRSDAMSAHLPTPPVLFRYGNTVFCLDQGYLTASKTYIMSKICDKLIFIIIRQMDI